MGGGLRHFLVWMGSFWFCDGGGWICERGGCVVKLSFRLVFFSLVVRFLGLSGLVVLVVLFGVIVGGRSLYQIQAGWMDGWMDDGWRSRAACESFRDQIGGVQKGTTRS